MFQQKGTSPPLAGVRVLDLGRYHAAPRCAAELGRLGAEVIKVEPIGGEESRLVGPQHGGVSIAWALQNSAKRSVAIDLRSEAGRGLLRRLAPLSDVVVQNFRPGVIEEMGLAYEFLHAANRRLILVNISGFGGSDRRPAFDPVLQATSGLMSLNGDPAGEPFLIPFPVVDRLAAMNATVATLAALLETGRSGEGREIEVTLADAALSTVETPLAAYLITGETPERAGNATGLGNAFACRDGQVYIGDYGSDRVFGRLARHLGRPGWPSEPRFSTRSARIENSGLIEAALVNWCESLDVAVAVASLEAAEIPCGRVNDIPRAASKGAAGWDPRAALANHEGLRAHTRRAPRPGEHTDEVLTALLGCSASEISEMRQAGTIA